MTRHFVRWCIRGCGKKVTLFQKYNGTAKLKTLYKCNECGETFTKKQLSKMNTFKKTNKEREDERKKENSLRFNA